MIEPFKIVPAFICSNCGKDTIEIFDFFGNPVRYKAMILGKPESLEFLKDRNIYSMKCKNCGMEYKMEWKDDASYPIPIRENNLEKLFKEVFISKDKY